MPENHHLREVLLHYFLLEKNASEAQRILVNTYGEHALSESTCRKWFQRFRTGDYDLNDKDGKNKETPKDKPSTPREKPSTACEDADLQALLDEDNAQSLKQLAETLNVTPATISNHLHAMGKIFKEGKWVPQQLSLQQRAQRTATCRWHLARHNSESILHLIITSGEKFIYFDSAKRRKTTTDLGSNNNKALLCIFWDQKGVLYQELLKPSEIVTSARYKQQLINLNRALKAKRPEWADRKERVIFLYDNTGTQHVSELVQKQLKALDWENYPHPLNSPDIVSSDYHLFRSMANALDQQHFTSFEEAKQWIDRWIASKPAKFFHDGIGKLPKNWEKVVANDGNYI